jgi:hypothetical protein
MLIVILGCSGSEDARLNGRWVVVSSNESVVFNEGGVGRFLLPEGKRILHRRFEWRMGGAGEILFTLFDEEGNESPDLRATYSFDGDDLLLNLDHVIPISDMKKVRLRREVGVGE